MTAREAFETARSAKESFDRHSDADTPTKRLITAMYRTLEAMVENSTTCPGPDSAKSAKVPPRQRETVAV